MTIQTPYSPLTRLEQGLLVALCLTLPGFEAPKNIFLWSFLVYWLLRRLVQKGRTELYGPNDWWFDGLLVSILIAGLISGVMSSSPITSFVDGLDFLSIAALAIVLRRSKISGSQYVAGLVCIVTGVWIALLDASLRRGMSFPTLHSVGHINHVAIYLGTTAAAMLGIFWRTETKLQRTLGLLFFLVLGWITLQTGSRNTAFGLLVLLLLVSLLGFFIDGRKFMSLFMCGLLVVVVGSVTITKPYFYQRQVGNLQAGSFDPAREKILYTAWVVGSAAPFFGHGIGQWSVATQPDNVKKLLLEQKKAYSSDHFFFISHGHNLAATWYVERGAIALLLLAIFFVINVRRLIKFLSVNCRHSVTQAVALVSLCTVALFGIGNTTLHHEHGLLALSLLALGSQGTVSR